ncbi:MAG: ammonium transporter, partial [Candidatus Eremiobacteraeota bacterium]|nr:ammonium transporter [Candidatus Eremiobacteraeota bacterium]
MLWLINLVTRVKVDEVAEQSGLDAALHGEEAYPLGV